MSSDPGDLDQVRRGYERAAEAGDTWAAYELGHLLVQNLNPPDLEGARLWWTRAAEAGNTSAASCLGLLLAEGLDPPDLEGACHWYERAAETECRNFGDADGHLFGSDIQFGAVILGAQIRHNCASQQADDGERCERSPDRRRCRLVTSIRLSFRPNPSSIEGHASLATTSQDRRRPRRGQKV